MRTRLSFAVATACGVFLLGLMTSPAHAQYGARPASTTPPGEDYHVEIAGGFWNPTPDIVISSEALGRVGSEIDFVNDLGLTKKQFGDLRIVLRPTKKSKFRIGYTPVKYTQSATLTRSIEFNAQRFDISLPVDSELEWKQWRFGYEYDFVYNDKGYAGLILDVKYTDVTATLSNRLVGTEFTHAKAPIPAIGGVGRVYVHPSVSITFELTALKVPTIQEKYEATFIDWDLNSTFNINRNLGAQVGYRSLGVNYLFDKDTGDMTLRGLYFGGVARF
ncbi:MAG: hypothetical protein HYU53_10930 [Acidobacteria bacterium]|nr:hypothetical protein [Acidobacteriota bacterium]